MENINKVLNNCLPFMPIELNQIISEYAYNPFDKVIQELTTKLLTINKMIKFCEEYFNYEEDEEQFFATPYTYYDISIIRIQKHFERFSRNEKTKRRTASDFKNDYTRKGYKAFVDNWEDFDYYEPLWR